MENHLCNGCVESLGVQWGEDAWGETPCPAVGSLGTPGNLGWLTLAQTQGGRCWGFGGDSLSQSNGRVAERPKGTPQNPSIPLPGCGKRGSEYHSDAGNMPDT